MDSQLSHFKNMYINNLVQLQNYQLLITLYQCLFQEYQFGSHNYQSQFQSCSIPEQHKSKQQNIIMSIFRFQPIFEIQVLWFKINQHQKLNCHEYNYFFEQLMILHMDPQQCDSFQEDDIDYQQAQLIDLKGPTLTELQHIQQDHPIISLGSLDIIKLLLSQEGKDIKFVGNHQDSQYKAFCYILLSLGVDQRNHYPHLNTLIRQQFYKPDILKDQREERNRSDLQQMLDKSLQYFEQVGNGNIKTQEYMHHESLFEKACVIMLKNSVQINEPASVYEQLTNKFNIDMEIIKSDDQSGCYLLGHNKNFYIIRQQGYFLLATLNLNETRQQKIENESIQSQQFMPLIIEASDGSTPQFMNSEAKYRQKSHKDSFGGDIDLQYKDAALHFQGQRRNTKNNVKLLSDYYQQNDVESCAQHIEEKTMGKVIKRNSFQQIIDGQKVEMKQSTTIEPSNQLISNFQLRQNRKISSSEIIKYQQNSQKSWKVGQKQVPVEEEQEEDPNTKGDSFHSLVFPKKEGLQSSMKTSKFQNRLLEKIQERQSSQKESTYPDQSSEPASEANAQIMDGQDESLVKIKDRKDSYFTQQMASSKAKIQKQIDSGNYVFKIPKNTHKNSQVILPTTKQGELFKRHFQENLLRFSQLRSPSDDNLLNSSQPTERKKMPHRANLRLDQSLYSYQIKFEPDFWYKKQIIYYLPNNIRQILVFQKSYPIPKDPPKLAIDISANYQDRQSFQSSNTIVSKMKMKQSCNFTNVFRTPSQISSSHKSFDINQGAFRKNRIQSMMPVFKNSLQIPTVSIPNARNANSVPQSLTKSKIKFNYLSSNIPISNQTSNISLSQSNHSNIINTNTKNDNSFVSQTSRVAHPLSSIIKDNITIPSRVGLHPIDRHQREFVNR